MRQSLDWVVLGSKIYVLAYVDETKYPMAVLWRYKMAQYPSSYSAHPFKTSQIIHAQKKNIWFPNKTLFSIAKLLGLTITEI